MKNFVPIIKSIESLAKKAAKPKWEIEEKDLKDVKKKKYQVLLKKI